jgi:hypothetical protein
MEESAFLEVPMKAIEFEAILKPDDSLCVPMSSADDEAG